MNDLLEIHPIVFTEDDKQWLEWQLYLSHKICEVFGISQQELMGEGTFRGRETASTLGASYLGSVTSFG